MSPGIEYELIPPKDENGYQWRTTKKLTIIKPQPATTQRAAE